MVRTQISLPDDLINEIDRLVGQRNRIGFLTTAVEKELKRLRRIEAAEHAGGSLRDAVVPPEWATSEGAAEWVREIRRWPDHWDSPHDDTSSSEASS